MDEEVLDKLDGRITDALKRKRIPELTKLNLEVLQIVMVYIRIDHPRTDRMYATYVPMAAAMALVMGTLIVKAAEGRLPAIWQALFGGP